MNPTSKFPPPSNQPGTLRWLLRFSFFLALFAVIALLVIYVIINLKGTDIPRATTLSPANQPSPAASASATPVLPSGTAGHAAEKSEPPKRP